MGVDIHCIRSFSRFPTVFLLSRLLPGFFRWTALCLEGRVASHSLLLSAPLLPELVSAQLSPHLCQFPARRELTARQISRTTLSSGSSPPIFVPVSASP